MRHRFPLSIYLAFFFFTLNCPVSSHNLFRCRKKNGTSLASFSSTKESIWKETNNEFTCEKRNNHNSNKLSAATVNSVRSLLNHIVRPTKNCYVGKGNMDYIQLRTFHKNISSMHVLQSFVIGEKQVKHLKKIGFVSEWYLPPHHTQLHMWKKSIGREGKRRENESKMKKVRKIIKIK